MSRSFPRILTRRRVLAGLAGTIAAPALVGCASLDDGGTDGRDPFTLGVASGDPEADGFVIWTRLAPEPLAPDPLRPGGMAPVPVRVAWEVASDAGFGSIVRRGETDALPDFAHSVHVEIAGLEPARDYWYRFAALGAASPIGRARTAPAPGASIDKLRFAFASCSNYEIGYFSAYRHIAADAPDLVLFLGDYIYEHVTRRTPTPRLHSDDVTATDLRTYRNRYAQYHTDPDLQALHAAAPCLATWDDHEVANDYADRWSERLDDPEVFLQRRAAAYRAFWEHMPLRWSALPKGPDARIHHRLAYGDLAEFFVVDGRQYRSKPACYAPPYGGGRIVADAACPDRLDPARSMLGAAQEAWLFDGLASSRARWTILAQDVIMAELNQHAADGTPVHWTDAWDGYPRSRARLLRHIQASAVANPVVLGGDFHAFWVTDLKPDFADPNSPTVATEIVGTSITSRGPPYEPFARIAADTPHVRFFESRQRGYVRAELTRERMLADLRIISDPGDPNATVATLRSFAIESGRPGALVA
jgi:alkaline phosphatase D